MFSIFDFSLGEFEEFLKSKLMRDFFLFTKRYREGEREQEFNTVSGTYIDVCSDSGSVRFSIQQHNRKFARNLLRSVG